MSNLAINPELVLTGNWMETWAGGGNVVGVHFDVDCKKKQIKLS